MITGANTNVRYRGVLFHVQTEDSGRANPHIISHLYHGGTILGSQKTDYSEHLETDDLLGIVKGLIDKQHAAMLSQLKSGGYDEVILERLGDTAAKAGIQAPPSAPDSKPDTRPDAGEQSPPQAPRAPDLKTAVEIHTRTAAERAQTQAPLRSDRTFGGSSSSGKPLDEVILDYLCDKARGRSSANRSKN